MRIDAVKLVLPTHGLTNDDVVALIRRHSCATYGGDLDGLLARIQALLHRSGAEHRYWLADHEMVTDLTARATAQALDTAGCAPEDVDMLIVASVDRGFVEPATAYFLAQMLGMPHVQCFDVVDACNGWSRALQLLSALFQAGTVKRAIVINAEFPMFAGGPIYPKLFTLRTPEELAWSFAGYTLGEGVAVTVVSADPTRVWDFHHASRPDLADLCTIPLPGYERYAPPSTRIGHHGVCQFTAFSGDMFGEATRELVALFRRLRTPIQELRAIFSHGATRRSWDEGAEALGVRHLMRYVYPQFGNLVSASIPAGLATAIDAGEINRGDRIACCGASAGMSFSVCSFVY
jgi:3-oxoacyl-[acyl-carrier-protein] synthase III